MKHPHHPHRRLRLRRCDSSRTAELVFAAAVALGGVRVAFAQDGDAACSAEDAIVIKKGQCDPTDSARCDELCNKHGSSYLRDECCAHVGKSASLLAFEEDSKWVPRIAEFNACTGASVRLEYLEEGEDGMAEALLRDVGSGSSAAATDDSVGGGGGGGEGIFDAYIVQGPWIPNVAEGLANLSPLIKEDGDVVDFLGINPASRSAVQFNGTVRALPLDTDYIAIGWRQDVFEMHADVLESKGIPNRPPKTIAELAEVSEALNGLDHNGDGQPDWGFCLTPQVNYFYAFVAPVFQTHLRECRVNMNGVTECAGPGYTGQNLFFDTDSFAPLIRNDGFKYAFDMYRRVIMSSNCQEQTAQGVKCDRKTAFPTGRCAGVISMPGTLTNMLREDGKYAPRPRIDESTNETLWRPGMNLEEGKYWGRRAPMPGSERVMAWDKESAGGRGGSGGTLEYCDEERCPLAVDGANRAPFFAEGGEAYALNGRQSKPAARNVMWALFTWLSTLPVTELPLSGQYRKSHIQGDEHRNELLESGWPGQMIDDLFEVLGEYFKDVDEGGNAVQDLLMVGFDEYMDILNEEIHKKLLLASTADGGLFDLSDPASSISPASDPEAFEERYERFVSALEERYEGVTATKSGGAIGQLQRWRQSLNLPWRTNMEICTHLLRTDLDSFRRLDCATNEDVDIRTLCATDNAAVEAYQGGACGVDDSKAMIAIITVSSILGAAIIGFLCWFLYNRWKKFRRIQNAHEQLMEDTIEEAQRSLTNLDYPLHLVRANDFVNETNFVQHETLRNRHKLVVIDSLQDVDAFIAAGNLVVFFSHQWTSFKAPDPSGKQFAAMCKALRHISEKNGHDGNLDKLYVWVDFSCIPQANPSTQTLAIRSLATYASSASIFVIVAPSCGHADLDVPCDVDTYQRRMWCRAEQVCHSLRNGTDKMHLATDDGLVPIDAEWFHSALHVFDGELTCCRLEHRGMAACDRQSLVIPILGLYGELYRASVQETEDENVSAAVSEFLDQIDKKQEAIFPRQFERVSWRKDKKVRETVLLFGDLIERMKHRVDQGEKGEGGGDGKDGGNKSSNGTASTGASQMGRGSDFLRHGVMHGANPALSDVKVETAVGSVDKDKAGFKDDIYNKV